MNTILKSFEDVKVSLIQRKAYRDAVANVIAADGIKLKGIIDEAQNLTDSILLVQKFANTLQSDVVKKFEELLTRGSRHIFGEEYTISIEFTNSGNTLHADFYAVLPNGKKVNVSNGEGGGLKDFMAVLQRMLYLILEPTQPTRILFIDECLKALDVHRSAEAFRFISDLARELDIQVVFVTHTNAAAELAGSDGIKVVEFIKSDGVSHANVIA